MVRVNLINPRFLTDQHLIAEYNEILMLAAYIKQNKPKDIPKDYCLGKGHMRFFKNKLLYLDKRHKRIKSEMIKRGFKPKKILKAKFNKKLYNDWNPNPKDIKIIKQRIIQKICLKPEFYRYYRRNRSRSYLINLIKRASF